MHKIATHDMLLNGVTRPADPNLFETEALLFLVKIQNDNEQIHVGIQMLAGSEY